MLFAFICTDKPHSLDLRVNTRPQHVEFLNSLGDSLKAGGPFLGEDGKMNGSLVIVEASDLAAAKAIAARDPYAKAGLFQSVEIRPWEWRMKNPEAK
jgi:uncharacterized protein